MLKSIILALMITFSVGLVAAQSPEAPATAVPQPAKLRDVQFGTGVDLQFLLKEMGSQTGMDVLFDAGSFRTPRKAKVELRDTSPAEAFNAILRQEHLVAVPVNPKTILIAAEAEANGPLPIGVALMPLSDQLRPYFGVKDGVLVQTVRADTPAAKAGIRAGDVITEIDNTPVRDVETFHRATMDKAGLEISLKIVRDRKPQSINVITPKGVGQ